MSKRLYLVETVSIFRERYVVKCEEESDALTFVEASLPDLTEFSQKHIGENITSCREISKGEYLELFEQDNDYLKSWPTDQKFGLINKLKK